MKEISNYSYTWKSEYILPYESQWSIRAKFCYLNGESYINFAKINKEKKIIGYLNIPMYIQNNGFMNMLKSQVYICPLCIKSGYHSVFHQYKVLKHCFIHSSTLLKKTRYEYIFPKYNSEKQDFYEKQAGIRVENIIHNEKILRLITEKIRFIEAKMEKCILCDFKKGMDNCNTYTDSTCRFILGNIFDLKCEQTGIEIYSIPKVEIFKASSDILYKERYFESLCHFKMKLFVDYSEKDIEEVVQSSLKYIVEDGLYVKYNKDISSLCVKNIVNKFISEECGGINEYLNYCNELLASDKYLENRKKSHISQYAKILAIYAITGSCQPEYFLSLGDNWSYISNICRFRLNIMFDMNRINNFYVKGSNKFRFKYTSDILCYVVIHDLFYNTSKELEKMLINNSINITDKYILYRDYDINIPQYIIDGSSDSIKIYRSY